MKKTLAILLSAVMMLGLLAGCGSSEEYWSMGESLNQPSSVKDDCPMGCKLLL